MRLFSRVLFMMIGSAALLSAQATTPVIPMLKGTTWTYSARVKWAGTGKQPDGVRTLTWTSTIVDSFEHGDVSAALLHGGPWDLAFYSPGAKPDDYLIVRAADAYYLVQDDARAKFTDLKTATAADIAEQFAADLWFRTPLEINDTYCAPGQEKTSPFYCWSVEKVTTTHSLRITGFRPKAATEYFLTFMTNPDTTMLTLVPGAGIVTYDYEHHGTVAEASVKLLSIRAGPNTSTRVASRRKASKTSRVK